MTRGELSSTVTRLRKEAAKIWSEGKGRRARAARLMGKGPGGTLILAGLIVTMIDEGWEHLSGERLLPEVVRDLLALLDGVEAWVPDITDVLDADDWLERAEAVWDIVTTGWRLASRARGVALDLLGEAWDAVTMSPFEAIRRAHAMRAAVIAVSNTVVTRRAPDAEVTPRVRRLPTGGALAAIGAPIPSDVSIPAWAFGVSLSTGVPVHDVITIRYQMRRHRA